MKHSYPKHFRDSLSKKQGYAQGGPVEEDLSYQIFEPDEPSVARRAPRSPAEYSYQTRKRIEREFDLSPREASETAASVTRSRFEDNPKWKTGDEPDYEGYEKGGPVRKRK
jgi:hypothetical protein